MILDAASRSCVAHNQTVISQIEGPRERFVGLLGRKEVGSSLYRLLSCLLFHTIILYLFALIRVTPLLVVPWQTGFYFLGTEIQAPRVLECSGPIHQTEPLSARLLDGLEDNNRALELILVTSVVVDLWWGAGHA